MTDLGSPPVASAQRARTRLRAVTHALDATAAGVETAAAVITMILLVTLVVVVLWEIAGREFSGGGAPWTSEAAIYLFIALTFAASSTSIARDTQPRILLIVDRLPARLSRSLKLVTDSATLVLYLFIFYYGIKLAQFQWDQSSVALDLSLGIAALPLAVGGALMFVSRLRRMRIGSWYEALVVAASVVAVWAVIEELPGTVSTGAFYPLIICLLVGCFCIGVPVAEALLLSALIAYKLTDGSGSDIQFIQQLFSGLNTFTYVAIPLFLLAGAIIAGTQMANRIIGFIKELLGWLPGSLGVADVVASAVFADLSGSAVSDSVAVGSVMIPELTRDGYPKPFSVALQASAGTLGVMFPPAVSALLFASAANVSVSYMFAATLLPGLIVTTSLALFVIFTALRRGYGQRVRFRPKAALKSGLMAVPGFGSIAIVLGGTFSGFFTSIEAGAVVALYSGLIGAADLSRNTFAGARKVVGDAAETVGRVCFIIAAALTFGWLIVQNYGPQDLVTNLTSLAAHPILLLLILMVVMLFVHTLLDVSATIVVVVPILLPLLLAAKINTVHFGVLLDTNSTVGLVLPPLGICLYLVSGIGNVKIEHAARAVLPFVTILLADMLLVLFVPSLTSLLPNALGLHP